MVSPALVLVSVVAWLLELLSLALTGVGAITVAVLVAAALLAAPLAPLLELAAAASELV